jgi:ketosteroid isomerase-like protein
VIVHTVDGTLLVNARNILTARRHRDTVQVRFTGDAEETPIPFHTEEGARAFFGRLITAIDDAEEAAEALVDQVSRLSDAAIGIRSLLEQRDANP